MKSLDIISIWKELSVMYLLRMCCKILCQNLVVYPKCMLFGSTKCHAFHALPTHPPTYLPQKWEFWILSFLDLASKVFHEDPLPPLPPEIGILDLSISGLGIKFSTSPPPPTHLPIPKMGILDFSISGLSSKSFPWAPSNLPPPHPIRNGNFGS